MRRQRLTGLGLSLCLSLCLAPYSSQAQAQATTPEELVETGQLQLRSWIEPTDNIVVGQEIQLTIEVSTQRWFAGGTSIRYPDEKNLIILRRDAFATNLSRREGSTTWVIQRWNLELYPQADGHYRLPAISLELAVNDALAGVVRGALETAPLEFSVEVPPALENVENWLATPMLTLEHELDRTLLDLAPGDAFTRRITLRATHLTAMMLPPLQTSELPGLPAYAETPQLSDTSNRGEATAERQQSITYVVEQAGQYLLPEQVFYWWDTSSRELKTLVLPELSVAAGIAPGNSSSDITTPALTRIRGTLLPFAMVGAVLGLCLGAGLLWRRRQPGRVSEAQLLRQVGRALRGGDNGRASRLLYHWLNVFQPQPDWYQLRAALTRAAGETATEGVDSLLASTYGEFGESGRIVLPKLQVTRGNRWRRRWHKLFLQPVELKLNPGDSAAE